MATWAFCPHLAACNKCIVPNCTKIKRLLARGFSSNQLPSAPPLSQFRGSLLISPSVNKWAAVSKCNTIDFVRSFRGRGEKKSRRKMEFSRAGRKMLNIVDGYAMVTQVFGRRRQPRGRKEGRK